MENTIEKDIVYMYNWFLRKCEEQGEDISLEKTRTDCALNVIDMYLKGIGELEANSRKQLFGIIKNKYTKNECVFLDMIVYDKDNSKAMIGSLQFLDYTPKYKEFKDKIKQRNYIRKINLDKKLDNEFKGQFIDILVRMFEILEVDLLFPCYIKNDKQEELFKSKGFVDCNLKANYGEKILIYKAVK